MKSSISQFEGLPSQVNSGKLRVEWDRQGRTEGGMNSNEGYQRKNDRMRVRVKGEDKMRQSETTWSR